MVFVNKVVEVFICVFAIIAAELEAFFLAR